VVSLDNTSSVGMSSGTKNKQSCHWTIFFKKINGR